MHRVIVIGSVNHDRIWQLDDALVPGGRLRFLTRETHLGGGGFYTGCQLLDLGVEVALLTRLMQDPQGLSALKTLQTMGFDTKQITMLPGETAPLEILLEPDGERTIIAPSGARNSPLPANGDLAGQAVYINALLMEDALVAKIDEAPLVVSQLPLRPATPRPADYVISSLSDAGGDVHMAWDKAHKIAGKRLKMLVLTNGPRPTTLFDGRNTISVESAPAVKVKSTIGAGDRFSGAFLFALLEGKDAAAAVWEASQRTAEWLKASQET